MSANKKINELEFLYTLFLVYRLFYVPNKSLSSWCTLVYQTTKETWSERLPLMFVTNIKVLFFVVVCDFY
jgi:hypothetical protein